MDLVVKRIIDQVGQVLLGKEHQVKLSLACLLARGHLLIEDLPGMGKTTLAHCLAATLGLDYDRVQFTSDLLPADILGVSVFDRNSSAFQFHAGPVFTQVLLADEINRSTPKTQSALLEAMEENQVTIEGETRQLPVPFFVIATQNPSTQSGTFPLPESQLDRFLMRISLGYPDESSEMALYKGVDPRAIIKTIKPMVSLPVLSRLQDAVNDVRATDQLLSYLQRLVHATRAEDKFTHGLSPRGALAWLRGAKAWALIHQRDYVVPDDIQAVMPAVVGHRIRSVEYGSADHGAMFDYLLKTVDVLGETA
ncbi:MAG: AAA family ATPase [Gammaproteobacteria bacterium]|nr:AAA family ATPase [Gammaproteobacteria bacterium]